MILPPLPAEAGPLPLALAPAGTAPTCRRFALLPLAARLAVGRHTGASLLRPPRGRAQGGKSSYQRARARAPWPGPQRACLLTRLLPRHLPPRGAAPLVGDGTADGHAGEKVYGQARHRDPVRPSHPSTAYRCGHTWAVLAVLARFPCATGPWALPVLVGRYRAAAEGRRRYGRRRARSGCARRWRCCTGRCRRASASGRCRGRARAG